MASLINVQNSLEGSQVATFQTSLKVKSGTAASIKAGMLVKRDGGNAGYVCAAADADTTSALILGVAASDSTETAAADGTVLIEAAPYLICKMKAKTPANLVRTMVLTNRYILDVTAGSYTMDQGTTTSGFITLIDYDNTTDGNCLVSIPCNGW